MKNLSFTSGSAAALAALLALTGLAAVFAAKAASALQSGLAESASIRVAKADSVCAVPSDEVHFVGCSSIL